MTYIVLFEDAKDSDPGTRQKHMEKHLTFLETHADKVQAAGPLSDPDSKGRDGLWIVNAMDEAEVVRLVHEDPFWPAGLRGSFSILKWKQVYASGRRVRKSDDAT